MGQPESPPEDPIPSREEFLEEVIQEALAPWREVAPAWFVEDVELYLRIMGVVHPVASSLVDRARPRQVPKTSGTQDLEGSSTTNEPRGTGTDDDHHR